MIDMSIEGLDDVLEMLERMDDATILKAARKGMQQGLQTIRLEAAQNCPVASGRLSKSIKTRTRIKDGELTGEVYTNVEYAVFVEMGTGPKGEASHEGVDPERLKETTYSPKGWVYPIKAKGGKKDVEFVFTRGQPARPFLYPAYKANQQKVYRKMTESVIEALQNGGDEG